MRSLKRTVNRVSRDPRVVLMQYLSRDPEPSRSGFFRDLISILLSPVHLRVGMGVSGRFPFVIISLDHRSISLRFHPLGWIRPEVEDRCCMRAAGVGPISIEYRRRHASH